jgi:hypothetical protein
MMPAITALARLYVIAVWAIITGGAELTAASARVGPLSRG